MRAQTQTSSSCWSRGPNEGDGILPIEGDEIIIEGGFVGVDRRGCDGVLNGER